MIRSFLFLPLLCCLVCSSAYAQKKASAKDYARSPMWIAMMKDPQVNYFETTKAFKILAAPRDA
jgi:hypothetical protein